jgi:hypothetical protein
MFLNVRNITLKITYKKSIIRIEACIVCVCVCVFFFFNVINVWCMIMDIKRPI